VAALTDADFAFIRLTHDGRIKRMTMINGSFMNDISGRQQLRTEQPVDELTVEYENGSLWLCASSQTGIRCRDNGGTRTVFANGSPVAFCSNSDGTLSFQG
jgi:hypothetical protein